MSPPDTQPEPFEGHGGGEHRTTGQRAWCFGCGEWCYPHEPCGQVRCCADTVGAWDKIAAKVGEYADRLDAEADRVGGLEPRTGKSGKAYNTAVATGVIAAARMLRQWCEDEMPLMPSQADSTDQVGSVKLREIDGV